MPQVCLTYASSPHVDTAKALLAALTPATNIYATPPSIVWPEAGVTASATTQCSSLFTLVFSRTYGFTETALKILLGSKMPDAARYYDAAGRPWFPFVQDVSQLREGDCLLTKVVAPAAGQPTGHCAWILGAPRPAPYPQRAVIPDTDQWLVDVFDSSAEGHGALDPRASVGGIGTGVMRLYCDAAGKIVGYAWSEKTPTVVLNSGGLGLCIAARLFGLPQAV